MSLLYRRQAVAAKIESTPGTVETLDTNDAGFVVSDPNLSENIQQIERDFFRDSLGTIPSLTGVRRGTVGFTTELTGSGDHTTTPPPFDVLMRACGFQWIPGVVAVPIGAVTGGPFVVDQVITGGTSGATAKVAVSTYSGAATLFLYDVTGNFQAEALQGPNAGSPSANSTAGEAAVGGMYRPRSTGFEHITIGWLAGDDTLDKALMVPVSGALGNVTLSTEVGDRIRMQFEFQGALNYPLSPDPDFFPSTEPAQVPPQFFNAQLRMLDGFEADAQSLTFGSGNNIGLPTSSKTATGLKPATIVNRQGTGDVDPIMTLASEHNSFQKRFDNETGAFSFQVGSTGGNRFVVCAPRGQYSGISPQERDGALAGQHNLQLHDLNGNDHMIILAV